MSNKIILVDFDGVLHSYASGWQGVDVISDPPVPGAIEWLKEIAFRKDFTVCIYSSRSSAPKGIDAMIEWLRKYLDVRLGVDGRTCTRADLPGVRQIVFVETRGDLLHGGELFFPTTKLPAFLTIDDRAICFEGTFPDPDYVAGFKPWNKRESIAKDREEVSFPIDVHLHQSPHSASLQGEFVDVSPYGARDRLKDDE